MTRYGLRDDQWGRIKDLLPGKPGDVGVTAGDKSPLRRGGSVSMVRGNPVARPAGALRRLEEHAPAVQPLGQNRDMGTPLSAPRYRCRQRIRDDRQTIVRAHQQPSAGAQKK